MWTDVESKIDFLNFNEVAYSINDIITTEELLPVSVGVFGDWGAGKSTIIELTKEKIRKNEQEYIQISFDAWLYQGYDDAKAALLETIASELLIIVKDNEGLYKKTKSLFARVNKIRALGIAADAGFATMGVPTGGLLGKLFGGISDKLTDDDISNDEAAIGEGIVAAKKFVGSNKDLISKEENKSPPQEIKAFRDEYSSILKEINKPLIIYVDNLDRCTPINAISTLEAIRLFLFLPKTAFVIAADEDMIRAAVQEYHKGSTVRHHTDYLDKLIQIPLYVPKPGVLEIRAYLFMLISIDMKLSLESRENIQKRLEESLQNAWQEDPVSIEQLVDELEDVDERYKGMLKNEFNIATKIAPILTSSENIKGNPRIVKRMLNQVRMRKKVADRRNMQLDEALITKFVIFERCAGKDATQHLYKIIDDESGFPAVLKKLESIDASEDDLVLPKQWEAVRDFIIDWSKLEPLLANKNLTSAAYLSRETIPLGSINAVISPAAKELVQTLLTIKVRSSGVAATAIAKTPSEEHVAVMDALIGYLKQEDSPAAKTPGMTGALCLAKSNSSCIATFDAYLSGLTPSRWVNVILKDLRGEE
jgi:predicted KAP-like P-loop ATPase